MLEDCGDFVRRLVGEACGQATADLIDRSASVFGVHEESFRGRTEPDQVNIS
jgi:hypothetical protein